MGKKKHKKDKAIDPAPVVAPAPPAPAPASPAPDDAAVSDESDMEGDDPFST